MAAWSFAGAARDSNLAKSSPHLNPAIQLTPGECRHCRLGAPRGRTVCNACDRQRHRVGVCPTCDGPIYGPEKFCQTCGPYRPPRPLGPHEVLFVLIDPRGREREVYRRAGEKAPGSGKTVQVPRREQDRYVVLDVTNDLWKRVRLLPLPGELHSIEPKKAKKTKKKVQRGRGHRRDSRRRRRR